MTPLRCFLVLFVFTFVVACGEDGAVLEAHSQHSAYIVTFYDDGVWVSNQVVKGETQITLPNRSKDGLNFEGWLLNGTGVAMTGQYTVTGSVNFHAKWTGTAPNGFNVAFVTNGGSAIPTINNVSSVAAEPVTTREGYTFDGWFTNSNLDQTGDRVTFPYTVRGNTTLYAKWTMALPAQYTVTFYDDGVAIPELAETVINGTQITLPNITKTGYTLDGWLSDDIDTAMTGQYTVTGDVVFYAKWTEIAPVGFVVMFESYGGSAVLPLINVTSIAAEPIPTKTGYTFDGWFDNASLTGSRVAFPHTVTDNTILYAKWTEDESAGACCMCQMNRR